jgi:hypothetical protein
LDRAALAVKYADGETRGIFVEPLIIDRAAAAEIPTAEAVRE